MSENRGGEYTLGEEIANGVTHGVGAALSIVGLVILVTLASIYGDTRRIVCVSIYGASLVLLFLSSTFYHSIRSPKLKRLFKQIDHSAIYLLIAGSYTPFTLVSIRGGWGWTLFGLIWGLTIAGVTLKFFYLYRYRVLSVLFYLAMGWLAVIAIKPLLASVPIGGIKLIVAGGLCYTVGTVFYVWKRLPYGHAIWHLFVLGGSACHYFSVLLYVLPPAP
ncbi:MAG: hemolysin III family protein [Acidobacteria bacterium]|nr:hemolysin III family protein [Acidobacteriota bacterium]